MSRAADVTHYRDAAGGLVRLTGGVAELRVGDDWRVVDALLDLIVGGELEPLDEPDGPETKHLPGRHRQLDHGGGPAGALELQAGALRTFQAGFEAPLAGLRVEIDEEADTPVFAVLGGRLRDEDGRRRATFRLHLDGGRKRVLVDTLRASSTEEDALVDALATRITELAGTSGLTRIAVPAERLRMSGGGAPWARAGFGFRPPANEDDPGGASDLVDALDRLARGTPSPGEPVTRLGDLDPSEVARLRAELSGPDPITPAELRTRGELGRLLVDEYGWLGVRAVPGATKALGVVVVELEVGGWGHEVKAVRHVRTPEGARRFGQPIGSVIALDAPEAPRPRARARPAPPRPAVPDTDAVAPPAEARAARELADRKVAGAPVPSDADVDHKHRELERARAGQGRAGGEKEPSPAARKREQKRRLFSEFGGDERGYVPCHGCGLKMHHRPPGDPENPQGYPSFERGKIFVGCQGGRYRDDRNLLPECRGCNSARGAGLVRPERSDRCR